MSNPNQSAYFWLPLREASAEWEAEWAELMTVDDAWLEKKLQRRNTINEHITYLENFAPEVFTCEPGWVIDIGPGVGALLEIARAIGHEAIGVDAIPESTVGMGRHYVRACEMMWNRQDMEVWRIGGRRYFDLSFASRSDLRFPHDNDAVLINLRGSLEQVFGRFLNKPAYQRSRHLRWLMAMPLAEAFDSMAHSAFRMLRPGGVFLIYANGTQNADVADTLLRQSATAAGFRIEIAEPRLHKWVKPC